MRGLSKKAVDLLDYNGYSYKHKNSIITFRKRFDYIGSIVLILVVFFVSLIFFPFGLAFLALTIIGVIWYRAAVIKNNTLRFDMNINRAYIFDRKILFKHISAFYLRSKFVSEYSSSHKSTSKEYKVTMSVEFVRGGRYELFGFVSYYEKPSKEIEEIHDFLMSVVKESN